MGAISVCVRHDKDVVLTFDDGPWPQNTPAVLKALADECLRATFFEIGKHATWHAEMTKQLIHAGMTVGTHTWSHEDLARNPYANDLEQAEQEIEMGNSAVHMAAGGAVAPFFRFPDLSTRHSFFRTSASAISRSFRPISTHATSRCTSRTR
jgi:peptidoglycan-N-acetylglucosamine deacetylase